MFTKQTFVEEFIFYHLKQFEAEYEVNISFFKLIVTRLTYILGSFVPNIGHQLMNKST